MLSRIPILFIILIHSCGLFAQDLPGKRFYFHIDSLLMKGPEAWEYMQVIRREIKEPASPYAHFLQGIHKRLYFELDSSEYHLSVAAASFAQIPDSDMVMLSIAHLGVCYLFGNQTDKAINLFHQVLNYAGNRQHCDLRHLAHYNLGKAYYVMKDAPTAVRHLQDALTAPCLTNPRRSSVYYYLGNISMEQGDLALADHYFQKGLAAFDRTDSSEYRSSYYTVYGALQKNLHQYELADQYMKDAIRIALAAKSVGRLSFALTNIALLYQEQGKPEEAVRIMESLLDEQEQTVDIATSKITFYRLIQRAYEATGDFTKAYRYLQKADSLQVTNYNEAIANSISEYEQKYRAEKQKRENLELIQENRIKGMELAEEKRERRNLIFIFSGAALILLMGAGFFWRMQKLEREKLFERQEREKQKEMAMAAIEAEEQERKRVALDLHDGVGQILSALRMQVEMMEDDVDESGKELIGRNLLLLDQAIGEVRSTSHNLMPAALIRKGLADAVDDLSRKISAAGKIGVKLHLEKLPPLPKAAEVNIYRIIQEVTGNMIRHSGATEINISLKAEKEAISLNISDNGKGMEASEIDASAGLGWKNLRFRTDMLNGNMQIDTAPGKGMKISFVFYPEASV